MDRPNVKGGITLQGSISTKDTNNLVEVDGPNISKCLNVVDMFGYKLSNPNVSY